MCSHVYCIFLKFYCSDLFIEVESNMIFYLLFVCLFICLFYFPDEVCVNAMISYMTDSCNCSDSSDIELSDEWVGKKSPKLSRGNRSPKHSRYLSLQWSRFCRNDIIRFLFTIFNSNPKHYPSLIHLIQKLKLPKYVIFII